MTGKMDSLLVIYTMLFFLLKLTKSKKAGDEVEVGLVLAVAAVSMVSLRFSAAESFMSGVVRNSIMSIGAPGDSGIGPDAFEDTRAR